eukprot:801896_1
MSSDDEDEDDPLGDTLGNLDDFSDSEVDDAVITVRPYRATDQICFVPVEPHQPSYPSAISPILDSVIMEDTPSAVTVVQTNTNDNHSDAPQSPSNDPYGPGQINLNDSDYTDDEESYGSSTYSEEDDDSEYIQNQQKNVDFAEPKRRSMEPVSNYKPSLARNQSQKSLRNLLTKHVSQFKPPEFDICLLISAPLTIKIRKKPQSSHNRSVRMSRAFGAPSVRSSAIDREVLLEYIRNSLPDRLELQQTVRQTLVRRNIRMRYAHFTSTIESIQQLSTFGGCKVLQYVGYCCNPKRDMEKYPILCKALRDNHTTVEDADYILLETEVGHEGADDGISAFGKGVWYKASDLYEMLNANKTQIDCIIAVSPQHERLIEIFKTLGYSYIIGVEAPDCSSTFSTTETSAFLRHLYAALLEQRSVSRAYYLSLQAALTSRGSVRGGNETDPKYILEINEAHLDERFIIFDKTDLKYGEINDKSQHEKLPRTNLREPVRPFIGRTQYVIHLLKKLTETQIVNVTGKELIGRASVVKSITRYLLQMGFFRGGCFVIDCKLHSRKYQQKRKSFNECVYDVLKSAGIDFNIIHYLNDDDEEEDVPLMNALAVPTHSRGHYSSRSSSRFPNLDKIQQSPKHGPMKSPNKKDTGDPKTSTHSLFEYLENSIFYDQKPPCHEPFCFVILNMNHWYNGARKVTQWISEFSAQLFKKDDEDSRIICTGKDPVHIGKVSTVNMKELSEFSPAKLARLFKYFCADLKGPFKFNPSVEAIASHNALQTIFDGRPGMTKKVSQYVRYLFASNDMKEYEDDEEQKVNKKKLKVTLDEIAINYPTSEYAIKFKEAQQTQPSIPPPPPQAPQAYTQLRSMFNNASNSTPSDVGVPQFRDMRQLDDSCLQLNGEGRRNLIPGSTSTPTIVSNKHKMFSIQQPDPAVLIPEKHEELATIMPAGGQRAGGSPQMRSMTNMNALNNGYPNININYYYHHHQAMNNGSASAYQMGYNVNMADQMRYGNYNQMQRLQMQRFAHSSNSAIPPPPPQQPNQMVPSTQHVPNFTQQRPAIQSYSKMPAAHVFGTGNPIDASQSMSQLGNQYRPPLQNTLTSPQQIPQQNLSQIENLIPTQKPRYNESIETLKKTAQKKQVRNGKAKHVSDSVASLFGGSPESDGKDVKPPHFNKSQKIELSAPKPLVQAQTSLKFVISDANSNDHHLQTFSEFRAGSVINNMDSLNPNAGHRLRNFNNSIAISPDYESKNETNGDDQKLSTSSRQSSTQSQPVSPQLCAIPSRNTVEDGDTFHIGAPSMTSPPLFPRMGSRKVGGTHRRSSSVPEYTAMGMAGFRGKSRQNSLLQAIGMNRCNSIERSGSIAIHISGNGNDKHGYNRSNLVVNTDFTGHSVQFSNLTEISVLNEQTNMDQDMANNLTVLPTTLPHQKNTSFLVNPMEVVKEGQKHLGTQVSIDIGNLKSSPSKPKVPNQGQRVSETGDPPTLVIHHSYHARKIWMNSSKTHVASLHALYPHLIDEFLRLTKCESRHPTLQQIELFFVRTGGVYGVNDALPFITADKFDKFFAWFRSMCSIINDLRPMYNRAEDPLVGLFYGRKTAQETLEHKPEGTFILRLASQENGLAITYKNPIGKIQNVLLKRISNEMYKVGKSDKETLLFHLIRPWPKLKYLYTPSQLIRKKLLF